MDAPTPRGGTSGVDSAPGQLLYMVDDKTLVLSDSSGHGNIISGFAPDILQQALAEVTATPVTTTVGGETDLFGSLKADHHPEEAKLMSLEDVSEAQNALLLEELANVAAVDTNTAAATQSLVHPPGEAGVVTVVRAQDGTLEISSDSAKALGLSLSPVRAPASVYPPLKSHSPQFVASVPKGTAGAKPVAANMVLIPTTGPDGAITYVLKSCSPLKSSPTYRPALSASSGARPAIIGRRTLVASPQPTGRATPLASMLRPVMSPSVIKSTTPHRRSVHPLILPKPEPIRPRPPTYSMIMPHHGALLPASRAFMPVMRPKTIKVIQKGSTFHSIQPLTRDQRSQVQSALESAQHSHASEHRGESKVIFDQKTNTKVVYKVVYPEDVGLVDLVSLDPKPMKLKDTAARVDTSDEDNQSPTPPPGERGHQYHRVESRPSTAASKKAANGRKRGRPRRGEGVTEKPELHVKKLREEFGLTSQQIQAVGKGIVSDVTNLKGLNSPDGNPTGEDEDESKTVSAISMTRSGRVSKPPLAKDGLPKTNRQSKLENKGQDPNLGEEAPKPKRRFFVPDRYRCRVCDKIYLGDRKMARHMKHFPDHGPKETHPVQKAPVIQPLPIPTVSSHSLLANSHMGGKYPGKKMPEFSVPIIPMARTQLEELVKNLDAELVLDVVGKKMFDNFSMWQLESKKISALPEKSSIDRLGRMFDDLERMLSETKKIVDRCLIDTKLCDGEMPSVIFGEHMQSALNVHEGPWYLEQPKHIPDEFHRLLGIHHAMMVSPRSDSTNPTLGHADDDNSNSLMSFSSDKDHSLGAQVVLEQNLGARNLHLDEDSQDSSVEHNKGDHKGDHHAQSPESISHGEEDSNLSLTNASQVNHGEKVSSSGKCSDSAARQLVMEIDALGSFDASGVESRQTEPVPVSTASATSTSAKLPSFSSFMSGNSSPKESHLSSMSSAVASGLISGQDVVASPVPLLDDDQEQLANAIQAVFSSTNAGPNMSEDHIMGGTGPPSVCHEGPHKSHVNSPFQSGPPSVSSHPIGGSNVLSNPGTPLGERRHSVDMMQVQSSLHHSVQNSPAPSLGPRTPLSQHLVVCSGDNAVPTPNPTPLTVQTTMDFCGPLNLDELHTMSYPTEDVVAQPANASDIQPATPSLSTQSSQVLETDASGPGCGFTDQSSLLDHLSVQSNCMESADPPSVTHFSNPPSVASVHQMDACAHMNSMVSGPPSVNSHHGPPSVASHHGPPSVASHHGPPSVASIIDTHMEHQTMGHSVMDLPHSPYLDQRQAHSVPPPSGPPSIHASGPPSVDMRLMSNHCNSGEHLHHSIPNSPLSEVLSDVEQFHTTPMSQANSRRNSISSVGAGSGVGSSLTTNDVCYGPIGPSMPTTTTVTCQTQIAPATLTDPIFDDSMGTTTMGMGSSTEHLPTDTVLAMTSHVDDNAVSGEPFADDSRRLEKAGGSNTDVGFDSSGVGACTLEPHLTNTYIPNPGLKSDTSVVFTSDKPSCSKSLAPVGPNPPEDLLNTSSASSNHFLSDLESVLNDNSNFSFTSTLNTEADQMKTPEKFLHSIPPRSIMVNKPASSEVKLLDQSHFLPVGGDDTSNSGFPVSTVSEDSNCVSTAADSLSKLFDEMTHPESKGPLLPPSTSS